MAMKEIEKLTPKQEFLKAFEATYKDDYLPEEYSDKKKKRIMEEMSPGKIRSLMFTSIPMVCKNDKCMFAQSCPLFKEDLAPTGLPCPYEAGMVKNLMADYMDQLDVEPDNGIELSMIRDMVDEEIQYFRKTRILSREDFIQENVVGVDADGEPVLRKELHLAVDLEDKLHKRRQVLRKEFLASREAKSKANIGAINTAASLSTLMSNLRQHELEQEAMTKRLLGIVDQDDYIETDLSE